MDKNKILLGLVRIIHRLIVYFIILGVFLPPKYLIFFLPVWPFIYLHWQINSNRCIMTEIEYWIESNPYPSTIDLDHDYPFIRSISWNLFDNLTNGQLHKLIVGGFTLVWFIGLIRYYNYVKKN